MKQCDCVTEFILDVHETIRKFCYTFLNYVKPANLIEMESQLIPNQCTTGKQNVLHFNS